jgi:hypothetical protein
MDLRDPPVHADRYLSLLTDAIRLGQQPPARIRYSAGPAFTFPDMLTQSPEVVIVQDERLLQHDFRGWIAGEIAAGRSPVTAVIRDGHPVSICFSARRSDVAAEAGVKPPRRFAAKDLVRV